MLEHNKITDKLGRTIQMDLFEFDDRIRGESKWNQKRRKKTTPIFGKSLTIHVRLSEQRTRTMPDAMPCHVVLLLSLHYFRNAGAHTVLFLFG